MPSEEPPPELERLPAPEVGVPGCGAFRIATPGRWQVDHPLLAPLQSGWHPRAENGRPIAVREALAPWSIPGHDFIEVGLAGVPRDVQPCWVPSTAAPPDPLECGIVWKLLYDAPAEARPRTARDWAVLVATEDGAAAVFATPDELASCGGTPASVRDWTPGLRGTAEAPELTFVERIDNDRSATWLRVDLTHRNGVLHVEHSEIATVMQAPVLPPKPENVPAWRETWPLSDDPIDARLGQRVPRIHPLWRTPVSDACPAVMFSSLTPDISSGDTFSRVTGRLADIEVARLSVEPSEVIVLHDHLDLPGVRLIAASDTDAGCIMGWSHTHCLVADDAVWCPDGTKDDLEAIVDRFALDPDALSDAQWFELAVVMTGEPTFVLEPSLLSECTRSEDARANAPRVTRTPDRVTIAFTAINDDGNGVELEVEIHERRVNITRRVMWTLPARAGFE